MTQLGSDITLVSRLLLRVARRADADFFTDFINGWEDDKLQNLMDQCGQCTSQAYGGIDCCYDKGVVTKNEDANNCKIDSHFDEQGTFA